MTFGFANGKVRGVMDPTHPLATWLHQRMSRAEFARALGISEPHLSLMLQGKKSASLELAVRIEDYTEGQVPARTLLKQPLEAAE